MNSTAATKIALTALAAPVLATLAVGLAGAASADSSSSANDTVGQLSEQGYEVVVNKNGSAPLDECSVISTRQDRENHGGGPQRNQYVTVYVDAYCPTPAS